MGTTADFVVVGGGIAGSAMATVLARVGLHALMLERQKAYRDRVRGETMPAWGTKPLAREALRRVAPAEP